MTKKYKEAAVKDISTLGGAELDDDLPMEMSELDRFIVGVLNRRAWSLWKPKYEALNKVKVTVMVGKRKRCFYKCAMCGEDTFGGREVQVDHIEPRVDVKKGWQGLMSWIERTFVKVDKLQVLCIPCHKVKNLAEAQQRAEARKNRKDR